VGELLEFVLRLQKWLRYVGSALEPSWDQPVGEEASGWDFLLEREKGLAFWIGYSSCLAFLFSCIEIFFGVRLAELRDLVMDKG
jgi:hypothetical protein